MSEYDAQKDAVGSCYAAVAAKKERGDTHWPERQPDDPGVDPADEPLRLHERPFPFGLIWSVVAIEFAAIALFLWFMGMM